MLLWVTPANAQSVDISVLELCAALETPELQLGCFNAIIADNKIADTPETEVAEIPVSEPPVAEEHAAEIAAVPEARPPAEAMSQDAPAVDAATVSTPAAVATSTATVVVTTEPAVAALSVTPEPSAASVATAPDPVANSRLGEEHLERSESEEKAKEDEVFHATVTEVTKGRNKILYFHFDNGQIWRQNEARHLTYPKSGDFDIKITRGMMGEYRMRIGDNGRMVRIRRVQ